MQVNQQIWFKPGFFTGVNFGFFGRITELEDTETKYKLKVELELDDWEQNKDVLGESQKIELELEYDDTRIKEC